MNDTEVIGIKEDILSSPDYMPNSSKLSYFGNLTPIEIISSIEFEDLRNGIMQRIPENLHYSIKDGEIPITPVSNPYTMKSFGPIEFLVTEDDFELYKNTMKDGDLYKETFKRVNEKLSKTKVSEVDAETLYLEEEKLIDDVLPQIAEYAEKENKEVSDLGLVDMIKYNFSGFALVDENNEAISKSFRPVFFNNLADNYRKIGIVEAKLEQRRQNVGSGLYNSAMPEAPVVIPEAPVLEPVEEEEVEEGMGLGTKILLGGLGLAILGGVVSTIDFDGDGVSTGREVLNRTNPFSRDSNKNGVLDYQTMKLAPSDSRVQRFLNNDIIHRRASDGDYIFFGESDFASNPTHTDSEIGKQAQFLAIIPEQEYQKVVEDGKVADFNWDDDYGSNYFEKFIAGTPVNVKNDRYVIMSTYPGMEFEDVQSMNEFLREVAKIPNENIYQFNLQENNSKNLKDAIDSISETVDENDTVLVILDGEGLENRFFFYDGEDVSYQWVDDQLNKIDDGPNGPRAMIVSLEACFSGSAIPYLEKDNKPRVLLTSSSAENKSEFGTSCEFLKTFSNSAADKDRNGYVSIGEAAEYTRKNRPYDPQLSDVGNIGKDLYLTELEIKKDTT